MRRAGLVFIQRVLLLLNTITSDQKKGMDNPIIHMDNWPTGRRGFWPRKCTPERARIDEGGSRIAGIWPRNTGNTRTPNVFGARRREELDTDTSSAGQATDIRMSGRVGLRRNGRVRWRLAARGMKNKICDYVEPVSVSRRLLKSSLGRYATKLFQNLKSSVF